MIDSTSIPLNVWTHVVFTYDQRTAKIYLNGVLSNSTAKTNVIDTSTSSLLLGGKNTTDRTRDFNGSLDDVTIYYKALTAEQVANIYTRGHDYYDNTQTNFNARLVNTKIKQFEQPDTKINPYAPQNLNRYSFEMNNPFRNKDPTGHDTVFRDIKFINQFNEFFNKFFEGIDETAKQLSNNLNKAFEPKNPVEEAVKGVYDTTAGSYVDLFSYGAEECYYQDTKNVGSDNRKQNLRSHIESRRVDASYDITSIGLDVVTAKAFSSTKVFSGAANDILKGIKRVSSFYTFSTHSNLFRDVSENTIKSPWYAEDFNFGQTTSEDRTSTMYSDKADMTKSENNDKNYK